MLLSLMARESYILEASEVASGGAALQGSMV